MARAGRLYDDVVGVTETYLGPAADRFIARQIRNHLHKEPEELAKRDLVSLVDWIHIAMRLITEDSDLIDQYIDELKLIMKKK